MSDTWVLDNSSRSSVCHNVPSCCSFVLYTSPVLIVASESLMIEILSLWRKPTAPNLFSTSGIKPFKIPADHFVFVVKSNQFTEAKKFSGQALCFHGIKPFKIPADHLFLWWNPVSLQQLSGFQAKHTCFQTVLHFRSPSHRYKHFMCLCSRVSFHFPPGQ